MGILSGLFKSRDKPTNDKIKEMGISLEEAEKRKQSLETNKISSDNIYKILMNFEKLFSQS